MKTKEYWDSTFEHRFETLRKDTARPPLKVILVPHSHNDPGWLKTYINYFQSDTRQILNFIVAKMHEFRDMTFIWSEISFLQLWWDQAHPTKQRALRQLIDQGRFEITTGGWVMTDEANVHLYAMVDQLIEGHQWCRDHLNYTPVTGWSIDPFGHGSTVPYLLSAAGFKGTIIQRIHYAWKQWLAKHQHGDFVWTPAWSVPSAQQQQQPAALYTAPDPRGGRLLTHNMPFDIYSIKHSCGPHPFVCLNFDFRKIPGEYTEFSIKAQFINDENVEQKADLLLEQYARTASLYAHNVALIPIGDDFRYNKEREVEQQYTNYKRLIDYIMAHPERYQTEIGFGLPRDYFAAINERQGKFAALQGDFFVYSDIFTEGRPAYWSGYFATRPVYKMLSRELEHNLRGLEILFTVAFNRARQTGNYNALRVFEKNYEKMILARRNLGLFQHHDAITGTSKANVMRDYGLRLFESLQDAMKLQESAIELLVQRNVTNEHGFVVSELEREAYNQLARKSPIQVVVVPAQAAAEENDDGNGGRRAAQNGTDFVVYNSLAQERLEVITLRTMVPNVEVLDAEGRPQAIQVNPVWNVTDNVDQLGIPIVQNGEQQAARFRISERQFEVLFVVRLPALSLRTYTMRQTRRGTAEDRAQRATVYCADCTEQAADAKQQEQQRSGGNDEAAPPKQKQPNSSGGAGTFDVRVKRPGDIQLENAHMRLLFDEQTGFLRTVTMKETAGKKSIQCSIKFGAYRSAQFHSGAYLFKVDPEQEDGEHEVLQRYSGNVRVLITSGPVASDVTVIYGPFLAHTVRVFSTKTALDRAIYIENDVDFEPPPKNRETELYMQLVTDIENSAEGERRAPRKNKKAAEKSADASLPVFYTDQNGFQFHRRVKVPAVGIEGNYYPITTAAFMQDARTRLTLLTTHAQAAASLEPGQLEVMLDRRTLYDDYRGMGEGVVDSRLARHRFWLLLEQFDDADDEGNANTTASSSASEDNADESNNAAAAYALPSLFANQLSNALNYPANVYFIDRGVMAWRDQQAQLSGNGANSNSAAAPALRSLRRDVRLLAQPFPCDWHLVNLRTLTDPELPLFPAGSALLVLQRQGFSCARTLRSAAQRDDGCTEAVRRMEGVQLFGAAFVRVAKVQSTLLTGLRAHEEVRRWSGVQLEPMEMRTLNVSFAGT